MIKRYLGRVIGAAVTISSLALVGAVGASAGTLSFDITSSGKIVYDALTGTSYDGTYDVVMDAEDFTNLATGMDTLQTKITNLTAKYSTLNATNTEGLNNVISAANAVGITNLSTDSSLTTLISKISGLGTKKSSAKIATADNITEGKYLLTDAGWICGNGNDEKAEYAKGLANGIVQTQEIVNTNTTTSVVHHIHSTSTTTKTETNSSVDSSSVSTHMEEYSTTKGGCYQTPYQVISSYSHGSYTPFSSVSDFSVSGSTTSSNASSSKSQSTSGYDKHGYMYMVFNIDGTKYEYKLTLYAKSGVSDTNLKAKSYKYMVVMSPVGDDPIGLNQTSFTVKSLKDSNGNYTVLQIPFKFTLPKYHYVSGWSNGNKESGRLNPYYYIADNSSKDPTYDQDTYLSDSVNTVALQTTFMNFLELNSTNVSAVENYISTSSASGSEAYYSSYYPYLQIKISKATLTIYSDNGSIEGNTAYLGDNITFPYVTNGDTAIDGSTYIQTGAENVTYDYSYASGGSYSAAKIVYYELANGSSYVPIQYDYGKFFIIVEKNTGTANYATYYKASCGYTNGQIQNVTVTFVK